MVLSIIKQTILKFFPDISNHEWHLNRCIGSEVTAILMNTWILPTGGVASGRVCPAACSAGLFFFIYNFFSSDKVVGLDGEGSVVNGAYPI